MSLLCADIGGSFIRVGRVGAAGEVTDVASAVTPARDWEAFVAVLRSLTPAGTGTLGIAIPGLLARDGQVAAANLPCLAGRRVAPELAAALGRPVVIGNDADCFALAEAGGGAGRFHSIVLGVHPGQRCGRRPRRGWPARPRGGRMGSCAGRDVGPARHAALRLRAAVAASTRSAAHAGWSGGTPALAGVALDSRAVVAGVGWLGMPRAPDRWRHTWTPWLDRWHLR